MLFIGGQIEYQSILNDTKEKHIGTNEPKECKKKRGREAKIHLNTDGLSPEKGIQACQTMVKYSFCQKKDKNEK